MAMDRATCPSPHPTSSTRCAFRRWLRTKGRIRSSYSGSAPSVYRCCHHLECCSQSESPTTAARLSALRVSAQDLRAPEGPRRHPVTTEPRARPRIGNGRRLQRPAIHRAEQRLRDDRVYPRNKLLPPPGLADVTDRPRMKICAAAQGFTNMLSSNCDSAKVPWPCSDQHGVSNRGRREPGARLDQPSGSRARRCSRRGKPSARLTSCRRLPRIRGHPVVGPERGPPSGCCEQSGSPGQCSSMNSPIVPVTVAVGCHQHGVQLLSELRSFPMSHQLGD